MDFKDAQFTPESKKGTSRFRLLEFLKRDLSPREKGLLTPEQIGFIDAAKRVDFGYAHAYCGEERWSEIKRAEEIVMKHLALFAELIDEIEEGGFRVSVYAKKYDREADTPGEISVMLARNGNVVMVYDKLFGTDLRDITSDVWDKERLRLAIQKAKAEIEKQEKNLPEVKERASAEEGRFKKTA